LQEATKANPYEYAGDNPVNAVDTSGAISVFLLVYGIIPVGLAVVLSGPELTAGAGYIGVIATAVINGFLALVHASSSVVAAGNTIAAFVRGGLSQIGAACPGGAIILASTFTGDVPIFSCL
jgi:hypothetical protein